MATTATGLQRSVPDSGRECKFQRWERNRRWTFEDAFSALVQRHGIRIHDTCLKPSITVTAPSSLRDLRLSFAANPRLKPGAICRCPFGTNLLSVFQHDPGPDFRK